MERLINLANSREIVKNSILDVLGLAFIYLVPVFSHLFAFPVYYLEPMRIMVILAIAHTSKKNALILAFTLPLFSFLVSAHPSLIKTGLIASELILNVFLFYIIFNKFENKVAAVFGSVLLSKLAYYSIKYLFISTAVMSTSLISTPLLIQGAMILLFSLYFFLNEKFIQNDR